MFHQYAVDTTLTKPVISKDKKMFPNENDLISYLLQKTYNLDKDLVEPLLDLSYNREATYERYTFKTNPC